MHRLVAASRPFLVAASTVAVLLAATMVVTGACRVTCFPSSLNVTAGTPPVHFEVGVGASNPTHFPGFALSGNRTFFTGTLAARAGADLTVPDVVRLLGSAEVDRTVTLVGSSVANPHVEVLRWTLRNATATVAVLDHLAPSPTSTVVIPAGEALTLDLRVDLADGAGLDNASLPVTVQMELP